MKICDFFQVQGSRGLCNCNEDGEGGSYMGNDVEGGNEVVG